LRETANCRVAASVWKPERFADPGWYRLGRPKWSLPERMDSHNAVWIGWEPGRGLARVRYYHTDIAVVDFIDRRVTISSGGYQTMSTLNLINCVLETGIGRRVYQRGGRWYIAESAGMVQWPFVDGITFSFGGSVTTPGYGAIALPDRPPSDAARRTLERLAAASAREAWRRRPRSQRGLFPPRGRHGTEET